MSCKHPLKAFKIGVNEKTGHDKLKITSYDIDHIELVGDTWIPVPDSFYSTQAKRSVKKYTEIPCGQCIACRLQYSRDWAFRILLDMQKYGKGYFITLTYDDDHLPSHVVPEFVDSQGEIHNNVTLHSLVKKDLQDFMKSLRYYLGTDHIRFYACGEYGDLSARPHYHIIVWNCNIPDLKHYKSEYVGDIYCEYFNSELIQKAWKNKGYCVIGDADFNSIAYVSRYVTKKLKGVQREFYDRNNLVPEFCTMSRKPGIASDYFDEVFYPGNGFSKSSIFLSTNTKSISGNIPRYFKKKLEQIDEECYNDYKIRNQLQAEISKSIKMSKTSLNYLDQLANEEEILKKKLKILDRSEI